MSKGNKEKSLVSFGREGWGIILYCAAMFWFYVGMVNDGSNITAPAFAAKTGLDYSVVTEHGDNCRHCWFSFFYSFWSS